MIIAPIAWGCLRPRRIHSPPGRLTAASPSREIPLIGVAGSAHHPSFSPDGKQLAYGWGDEEGEHGAGINVKLVGGRDCASIDNGPQNDYFPAWSPDGQWIAFWRSLPTNSGVYVVSALGGPARRIIDLVGCWGLEWLPDGQHLVVSGGPNFLLPEQAGNGAPRATEPSRLWLVAVDTGQQQPITSPPTVIWRRSQSRRSPDGKTLAFTRSSAAITDVIPDADGRWSASLVNRARSYDLPGCPTATRLSSLLS